MEGFFDRLSSLTEFDLRAFRAAAARTRHGGRRVEAGRIRPAPVVAVLRPS